MTGGQRPTERSHKKKADEIRKRRKLWTAGPHTPRFAVRARAAGAGFARALVFPSITPFRADSLDAAHAPPRSERARPSRRRTYRVSPDVSSRPSVRSSARSRAHEWRSATRSIHAGDRLVADAREIRDDVGEEDPAVAATRLLLGVGRRRCRARDSSRRRRHATADPPIRAQRDRGFRVARSATNGARAGAPHSLSDPPPRPSLLLTAREQGGHEFQTGPLSVRTSVWGQTRRCLSTAGTTENSGSGEGA